MPKKVLTIFGTRPEAIKLAPVIHELETQPATFQTINVTSGQHRDLLDPFVRLFNLRIDHDLKVMQPNQTPNSVCARVLTSLEPILDQEQPNLILIQGDTTTAMAGALAGFHRRIPIGHVEAGLRSGNAYSPYPEEMNRRLITRLATYHFAATRHNQATLLSEGIREEQIFLTGNPVVDSLKTILRDATAGPFAEEVLRTTEGYRRVVLTTHRRESFGQVLAANLRVLRAFVGRHQDTALIFPVHANPAVVSPATEILSGHPRIYVIPPLNYQDFLFLLSHAWLIVSDSGGVQEEAPTLGKPLLVLRENTERPETIEAGVAQLVGGNPNRLARMLEEVYSGASWAQQVDHVPNPYGTGDSAERIVHVLRRLLSTSDEARAATSTIATSLGPAYAKVLYEQD